MLGGALYQIQHEWTKEIKTIRSKEQIIITTVTDGGAFLRFSPTSVDFLHKLKITMGPWAELTVPGVCDEHNPQTEDTPDPHHLQHRQ